MQELKTNKCKWTQDAEGSWVCFLVKPEEASRMAQTVDSGREYVLTVKQYRQKRSNDANAYFWVLAGKLSAVLGISPDEIYRSYVPDVGDNFTIVRVRSDRLKEWNRVWCDGHYGRLCRDLGESDLEGYHDVISFISSSDYDTKQMSRLIELAVQDCKEVGIETMTPDEQAKMLAAWEAHLA